MTIIFVIPASLKAMAGRQFYRTWYYSLNNKQTNNVIIQEYRYQFKLKNFTLIENSSFPVLHFKMINNNNNSI
ncbi:hypothetical protein LSH36_825g03052 [Paralvinella palmiformis]|uniref:Uncharacterized protein n=1 Tax=Paralvinella palmiformis TaxID=53620 RepID=A0AAD9J067_9ANNE|nr:hypothetical protein LSH36_825g03052 [Paralvinella palmiformis]